MQGRLPDGVVVLVGGLPATGKTTLATWLGGHLGTAVIARDRIKETLFDTLGTGDRAWSRSLGRASWELMYQYATVLAASGTPFLLENYFKAEVDEQPLRLLEQEHRCTVLQVVCRCAGDTLIRRFERRAEESERHTGHMDHEYLAELRELIAGPRHDIVPIDAAALIVRTDTCTRDSRREVLSWIGARLGEIDARDAPPPSMIGR